MRNNEQILKRLFDIQERLERLEAETKDLEKLVNEDEQDFEVMLDTLYFVRQSIGHASGRVYDEITSIERFLKNARVA